MAKIPYDVSTYQQAFLATLPQGSAWPKYQSVISQVCSGLALAVQKVDVAAVDLLSNAFPQTTTSLLAEWQQSCGLPDNAFETPENDDEARAQIVAKLIGVGGQSQQYYINLASVLGYSISIKTYTPWRCGSGRAGMPIYGQPWAYAWTLSGNGVDVFLWNVINQLKPAHTRLTPVN